MSSGRKFSLLQGGVFVFVVGDSYFQLLLVVYIIIYNYYTVTKVQNNSNNNTQYHKHQIGQKNKKKWGEKTLLFVLAGMTLVKLIKVFD